MLDASMFRELPEPPEPEPSNSTDSAWSQTEVEQLLSDAQTMRNVGLVSGGLTLFCLGLIAMRSRK